MPEVLNGSYWIAKIDNFSNIPLISAFVTKLDEPIKTFAGLVSQYPGEVASSSLMVYPIKLHKIFLCLIQQGYKI